MPRKITSSVFFYVYMLLSKKDSDHYVGHTRDLRKRVEEHRQGLVFATRPRRPPALIYFEGRRCKTAGTVPQDDRRAEMAGHEIKEF